MTTDTAAPAHELRLDDVAEGRLRLFAEAQGLTTEDALQVLLHLGIEVAEAQAIERDEQLAGLELELRDVKHLLHTIGPNALGATLLLAHWTAKSSNGGLGEDEFMATFEQTARDQWAMVLAKAGIAAPAEDQKA